jgi:hypothetical protein
MPMTESYIYGLRIFNYKFTHQVGAAVTLQTVFGKYSIRFLGIPIKVFHGFPQSFQANSRIAPRLDHDRFVPNPTQLFIHQLS